MLFKLLKLWLVISFACFFKVVQCQNDKINREALVSRHHVIIERFDSLSSLSVGNGAFAFTVDATGLQTFPDVYKNGVPLGTQSEWGWHSFPNSGNYNFSETLQEYDIANKKIPLPVQFENPGRKQDASNWFRQNPHRLHLGIIGFELYNKDGKIASVNDIKNIHQELDLWNGEIRSHFTFEGEPVDVITICHPNQDIISVKVISKLLKKDLIKFKLHFPYPTGNHTDDACDWNATDKHITTFNSKLNNTRITRKLDATFYFVNIKSNQPLHISQTEQHKILIEPNKDKESIELNFSFSDKKSFVSPSFSTIKKKTNQYWRSFWTSGGAIDFSGSTDSRALELERRIILSQYLMAIQCAGSIPPQETGLTYNSWFGRFHLEMHWWHAVHFALWNRIELLERSLDWYTKIKPQAAEIAERQGFEGVRWPKMTDPEGGEAPSSVGSFLIWQQPHFIYFAELCYRHHKNQKTLNKYKDLVFKTADFMADFAVYDSINQRYNLKGLIPAQERFIPEETLNAPLELAYWKWGLSTALEWCDRLNIQRHKKWEEVYNNLAVLPEKDGLYLAAASAPDSYTSKKYMTDHPAVLGSFGMLSGKNMIDTVIMQNTFNFIWDNWHWEETWGWDFPLTAMAAVRLHNPEKAMDALFMNQKTNKYLVNGHNYQNVRLRIYLPGNGGLLTAVAMMCAGFDGNRISSPGIPKNKNWKVKWENLSPIP
ncbi:MAG: hypothetical protein SFU99_10935 [Saprospiraceae bacterium]|nr:hypothetical protein [Saprospiraceae bacterium]